jgi:hypothetical protein
MVWTKSPYGGYPRFGGTWDYSAGGHWTITNGHLRFDIHLSSSGSDSKYNLERHNYEYIVSPKEADEYAQKILDILNAANIQLEEAPT